MSLGRIYLFIFIFKITSFPQCFRWFMFYMILPALENPLSQGTDEAVLRKATTSLNKVGSTFFLFSFYRVLQTSNVWFTQVQCDRLSRLLILCCFLLIIYYQERSAQNVALNGKCPRSSQIHCQKKGQLHSKQTHNSS